MKTHTLTNTLLAVITVALVVIAVRGHFTHNVTVSAAGFPRWQYKFVDRSYSYNGNGTFAASTWKEDGQSPPDAANNIGGLGSRIQVLGSQGWELVSDTAFSENGGFNPQGHVAANGVTTRESLIFRHLLPPQQ